jgi:hypothetical protein
MDVDTVSWLLVMLSALELERPLKAEVSGQVTKSPEQVGWVFMVTIG